MIYFNYVRGRNKELMLPVFDHNVQDIATLGALLLIFSRMIANPEGELLRKPLELWGLGGLCMKMGLMEKSLLCMRRALTLADDPDLTPLLLIHTARLYRKLGRMKDALRTWEHLMATSPRHRLTGAIELAKYYEHKARNPNRAREVILKALKGVEISSELESYISGVPSGSGAELTPELEKRLRRLERKIGLLH
jgi:tetratricopeptide (TPR) repeat protein